MPDQPDYNVEYWTTQEQVYLKQLHEQPAMATKNHMGLAMCYEIMHRYEDCFHHCSKIFELSKNNMEIADAHVWMGRAHHDLKELNPAIAHYLQTLDIDPDHDAALEEVGNCYSELKDYTNAEYWFTKLSELDNCEDVGWMCLGSLFYETKDYDRSIANYEKCINERNDNIEAWYGKGRSLADKKLYKEAIEVFKEAEKINPNDALGQYYIGACYQEMNDQYRAMHHYMRAIELDPAFAEVYNNIAKLYHDFDGDIKTAIDYLEKALERVEQGKLRQLICMNLARLYSRIADTEHAEYYKQEMLKELGFGDLLSFGDEGEEGDEDFGDEDDEDE